MTEEQQKEKRSTTVHDVAAYILEKQGEMTTIKLHRLVYYSQAWSLVWEAKPLFEEPIEAWSNGPISPDLYKEHRGQFTLTSVSKGDSSILNETEREDIDAVLDFYGHRTAQWLSDLARLEMPWNEARKRGFLETGERGSPLIWLSEMHWYYLSIAGPKGEDVI